MIVRVSPPDGEADRHRVEERQGVVGLQKIGEIAADDEDELVAADLEIGRGEERSVGAPVGIRDGGDELARAAVGGETRQRDRNAGSRPAAGRIQHVRRQATHVRELGIGTPRLPQEATGRHLIQGRSTGTSARGSIVRRRIARGPHGHDIDPVDEVPPVPCLTSGLGPRHVLVVYAGAVAVVLDAVLNGLGAAGKRPEHVRGRRHAGAPGV